MRPIALFSVLLLTVACAGDDESDPSTDWTDSTDSTDSTDNTDSTDSTDATDDTDLPPDITCLPSHGIHNGGSKWVYRWHNKNRTGSREVIVWERDEVYDTATLRTTDNWFQSAGSASFSSVRDDYYKCDEDGLYLLKTIRNSTLTVAGTKDVDSIETTYSEPSFLRPNSPVPGTTWTTRSKGETVENGAAPRSFDTSTLYGVSQGGIPVSGGFTGMKIETPEGSFYYWEEDVGVLYFNSIAWLVSHTP
ncbi:MAG: hypothetical protein AB8H79_08495 [Myxococcota bacterium]